MRNRMTQSGKRENGITVEDQVFFVAGWICVAVAVAGMILWKVKGDAFSVSLPQCMIHAVTGLYCPGCGGTRALVAFFHGQFLKSFFYHPIVVYTAVVGGCFLVSQTVERVSRRRFQIGMHFRPVYLWIALILVVGNCLVKNIALLCFHVRLL